LNVLQIRSIYIELFLLAQFVVFDLPFCLLKQFFVLVKFKALFC